MALKQRVLDIKRAVSAAVRENRAKIGPGLRRHPSEPTSARMLRSGKRGRDEPSGAGAHEEAAEGSDGESSEASASETPST